MKNYFLIFFTLLSAVFFEGCEGAKPDTKATTTTETQNNTKMEKINDLPQDVIKLIDDLNYWVSMGGDPQHPVGDIKSTGESHSRYLYLKDKILKRKFELKWEEDKYVLIKPVEE